MSGLAKIFVQGLRKIDSWTTLKRQLLREFTIKINSAELHQMLSTRKMRKDESAHEYLLKMKELASRGEIEEGAVIQYIVDGIPDDADRKLLLYEARTYGQLKKKLNSYEKVRTLGQMC